MLQLAALSRSGCSESEAEQDSLTHNGAILWGEVNQGKFLWPENEAHRNLVFLQRERKPHLLPVQIERQLAILLDEK